jgi:imidazolonepropionase
LNRKGAENAERSSSNSITRLFTYPKIFAFSAPLRLIKTTFARMSRILIKNIQSLLGVYDDAPTKLSGKTMNELPSIDNAWLAIEDGLIADYGTMADWPGISDWRGLEVIEADGRFVLPTWCDSHTHTVYAGSRVGEFVDRIQGLTYEQIAARGGGILNSAALLAITEEEVLIESALKRLNEMQAMGTGAVEIKSGYGLSLESELKMLRVIDRLKQVSPLTIKATFLGAHAIPKEYKANPDAYVDHLVEVMIPEVANQRLAEYIDVFCEENYFSVAQTERILEAGVKHGLRPKTHVNQFNAIGGVAASVKYNALSVDHLEVLTDADIAALQGSSTMPVALPGCSLFIKIPYTPARKIIDAGLPLALATDYNPGSAPSGNMNLVNSLACIYMGMTPNEVINASTLNGAYAMGLDATHGTITPGKKANIIITEPMDQLGAMMYSFGRNKIERVIIGA